MDLKLETARGLRESIASLCGIAVLVCHAFGTSERIAISCVGNWESVISWG